MGPVAFKWEACGTPPQMVVVLTGELDSAEVARCSGALLDLAATGPFSIDATALTFVDSSGLRLLLRLAEANCGTLRIANAAPALRRLVEITGVDAVLLAD